MLTSIVFNGNWNSRPGFFSVTPLSLQWITFALKIKRLTYFYVFFFHQILCPLCMFCKLYYKSDTKRCHSAIMSSACGNSCCVHVSAYKEALNFAVADVDLVVDDTWPFMFEKFHLPIVYKHTRYTSNLENTVCVFKQGRTNISPYCRSDLYIEMIMDYFTLLLDCLL